MCRPQAVTDRPYKFFRKLFAKFKVTSQSGFVFAFLTLTDDTGIGSLDADAGEIADLAGHGNDLIPGRITVSPFHFFITLFIDFIHS